MYTFQVLDENNNEIESEEINPFRQAKIEDNYLVVSNDTYDYAIDLNKYSNFRIKRM